jgi:hypothetical protein
VTRRRASGAPGIASPTPAGARRRADLEQERLRLRQLAWLLDQSITIPGTRFRFGLEPIIGLVPVVGDATGGIIGAYLIVRAWQFGLPRVVVVRMVANTLLDLVVGVVPLLGDLFDFAYRSNARNIALFERYAADPGQSTRREWLLFVVLIGGLVAAVVLAVVVAVWLVAALFEAL